MNHTNFKEIRKMKIEKIVRQIFTVQDMIDQLMKIKNKNIPIASKGADQDCEYVDVEIDLEITSKKVLIY